MRARYSFSSIQCPRNSDFPQYSDFLLLTNVLSTELDIPRKRDFLPADGRSHYIEERLHYISSNNIRGHLGNFQPAHLQKWFKLQQPTTILTNIVDEHLENIVTEILPLGDFGISEPWTDYPHLQVCMGWYVEQHNQPQNRQIHFFWQTIELLCFFQPQQVLKSRLFFLSFQAEFYMDLAWHQWDHLSNFEMLPNFLCRKCPILKLVFFKKFQQTRLCDKIVQIFMNIHKTKLKVKKWEIFFKIDN